MGTSENRNNEESVSDDSQTSAWMADMEDDEPEETLQRDADAVGESPASNMSDGKTS